MGICGKSDFEDFCEMHHSPEEILSKYEIYANKHDLVPLHMRDKKDLVAYYPWLITMMWSNKESGGKVHLSDEDYITAEEKERLQWEYDNVVRYYKRCKRKKEEFDKNVALELIVWFEPEPYQIELVNRIAEMGEKATIDNLHTKYHDSRRKEWFDLMVENGWDENMAYRWVYGFTRWLECTKENKISNNE